MAQISEPVCQLLKDFFGSLQQGNIQGCYNAVNVLSNQHRNETQSYLDAIINIQNFAQRSFGQ